MVGVFVRLKLRLMAGGLKGSAARRAALIVSWAVAAVFAVTGAFLFFLVRLAPPDIATDLGILLFSVFLLAWLILPVMSFGVDETLDPANLVMFPLRKRQLAVGMFAASAAGAWPAASLIFLLGGLAGLARDPAGAVLGTAAVLLLFAMSITASRAVTTALSGALRSRRGRDVLAAAGIVVILLFQLPNLVLTGGGADPAALLDGAAAAFRWTPPGMAAHAISAPVGVALAELLVVAVVVLALWWLWMKALDRSLTSPDSSTQGATVRRSSLGGMLPEGAMAAAVTKDLKYARRDPRVRVMMFTAVVMGIVIMLTSRGAGAFTAVMPPCMAAFFIGLTSANGFGIDGRALWMNSVIFSTTGDVRRHLAGRQLALALIGIPVVTLVALGGAIVGGSPWLALPGAALGFGVLGLALGLGAITCVCLPYTQPDRMSAFGSNAAPGQGALAFGSAIGGIIAVAVLCVPLLILVAIVGVWATALAVPYGLIVAWAGRRIAGRLGPRRFPEILAAVSRPI